MKRTHLRTVLCLLLIGVLALQLGGCAANKPADPAETGKNGGETTVMSNPIESKPAETTPAETTPAETTPAETTPIETEPAETNPIETDPPAEESRVVNLMATVTRNPAEAGTVAPDTAAAAADFAVRLFRAGYDPEQNTLISPLSVLCALSMTANGAKDLTLTQMESTLGLKRELWNDYFRAYLDACADDGILKLANSVWFTQKPGFSVNPDFLQTNADFYGADVFQAPFDDGTLPAINGWVKEKTDGMIPRMLDRIPEGAVMYLINALAFEAKWADPYDEYSVHSGVFNCADGTKRTVDFMYSEEHQYIEDEKAVGFIKPYENGKYAFVALLPKEGVSVQDYVNSLDGAAIQALLENASQDTVFANLPKFETAYSAELSGVLKSMGMEVPFDGDRADFTDLAVSDNNIYIGRVLHKTFISVAEEGTRAGAATVVEMVEGAVMIEDPKYVYLDRPFVYMLIDTETNTPFFLGAMLDPAA